MLFGYSSVARPNYWKAKEENQNWGPSQSEWFANSLRGNFSAARLYCKVHAVYCEVLAVEFPDQVMTIVRGRGAQHRGRRNLLTSRDIALKSALRALQAAGVITSPEAILNAARLTGNHPDITGSGLHQFITIDDRSMAPEAREPLERFVYETNLGLALRAPIQDAAIAIDTLISNLTTGVLAKPDNIEVEGFYFFYHGSYIRPDHFVVRLLEISREREVGFGATDTLRDNIAKPPFKLLEAKGAVSFLGNCPNIVFHARDNREGVSLLVSSQAVIDGTRLTSFTGQLSGITSARKPFARYCFGIRIDGATKDMSASLIEETGLYTIRKLPTQHRQAMSQFATTIPVPVFRDPILKFPGAIVTA